MHPGFESENRAIYKGKEYRLGRANRFLIGYSSDCL